MYSKLKMWLIVCALLVVCSYTHNVVAQDQSSSRDVNVPERKSSKMTLDDFFKTTSKEVDATQTIHQIPAVPVIVDGVRYSPENVGVFNGKALHFVLNEEGVKTGVLYAFTKTQDLQKFLEADANKPNVVRNAYEYSTFHEHPDFQGASLSLYPGQAYPDLGRQPLSCFLFWCSGSWNFITSSLLATPYARWTTLFDRINYTGSSFWIPGGILIRDLNVYGWNDRASSLYIFP